MEKYKAQINLLSKFNVAKSGILLSIVARAMVLNEYATGRKEV